MAAMTAKCDWGCVNNALLVTDRVKRDQMYERRCRFAVHNFYRPHGYALVDCHRRYTDRDDTGAEGACACVARIRGDVKAIPFRR